ncbi:MAG TPA: twin-arginine translocation signal domain-containing protein, partial [Terriglobia bacterium]|nr:twin-arginine translocation signal domain-containing protein [Terriglobia bacterium]
MNRRGFLRTGGLVGLMGSTGGKQVLGFVPAHNWEKYDFGSGPFVKDRLNQGPFPQYPPEEVVPGS